MVANLGVDGHHKLQTHYNRHGNKLVQVNVLLPPEAWILPNILILHKTL